MAAGRSFRSVWPLLGLAGLVWAGDPAPPAPSAKAKCPVCGMFVGKYPDWMGAVRFKDGTWSYFDGPKDLFNHLLRPGRSVAEAPTILVKDYYSLGFVDARSAVFVVGSTVTGPMGRELVPFAKEADARGFLKDHGGQRLLRFAEITPQVLKGLE